MTFGSTSLSFPHHHIITASPYFTPAIGRGTGRAGCVQFWVERGLWAGYYVHAYTLIYVHHPNFTHPRMFSPILEVGLKIFRTYTMEHCETFAFASTYPGSQGSRGSTWPSGTPDNWQKKQNKSQKTSFIMFWNVVVYMCKIPEFNYKSRRGYLYVCAM